MPSARSKFGQERFERRLGSIGGKRIGEEEDKVVTPNSAEFTGNEISESSCRLDRVYTREQPRSLEAIGELGRPSDNNCVPVRLHLGNHLTLRALCGSIRPRR